MEHTNLVDECVRPFETSEYRGATARGGAQGYEKKATGVQGPRIAVDGAQRFAKATQHFVENDDVEPLCGRIVLAIRHKEVTALVVLLPSHVDGGFGQVDPDIARRTGAREPAQQSALSAADIQHRASRLQVPYVAGEYAETAELREVRQEVPPPCGILRFPAPCGLQQAIGPTAAVAAQLQPACRPVDESEPAETVASHAVRPALAQQAGIILTIMSVLPILCYHNVAQPPREARFKLLYVSPEKFERQLWLLRRLGLQGVCTSEGIARMRDNTVRGRVVITFDDGYADALTTAAPILRRYGFSATCYLVSGALGTYNGWDAQHLQETKSLMSREQIDQWLAAGMEVGSHSCSHARLHELPKDTALYEIAESRAALRRIFAAAVDHFAYPFGQFTSEVVELVRHAGYLSAVTVAPGVARASDDYFRLPRILVNGERSLWRFLLHLGSPYERLRRHLYAP
jgi:peptidoglycan/xylan/chitin deacetylase (PgdA/CDA1 family)